MKFKNNKKILKSFNYAFGFVFIIWLIGGLTYIYDSYRDQKLIFLTKNSADLYQSSDVFLSPKIGIISPTDHVKVLRVLFIKDHLVIKVFANNRQTGWILKTADIDLK